MNDNEKWFEELRQWRIGGGVNRVVSLGDVDRHIAYCEELREREMGWTITLSSLEEENEKLKEELREALNVKFIPSGIARNKLDAMRAILQTHYQVRIEEPDAFAVDRIRELEEENAKLKEELLDEKRNNKRCDP